MNASIVTHVGGDVTAPTAVKIIAAYADGTKDDVPFVWVSSPIAAGFFTFDIPAVHWIRQHHEAPVAVSAISTAARLCSRSGQRCPMDALIFLENRQAARDLSLFVRSRRVQALRKEPAEQARNDLLRTFRTPLARSSIRITVVAPATLVFTERSTTGKLFAVTVQHGRIVRQNVKPYALVF